MLKERLLHPATIIATIALLVALSGVGYAATKIGTAQLKNNAVSTAKLKNNAVSTAKLKNGAVSTAKLKNNAVNSSKLASGAVRAADLGAGSVGGAALANGAVTAAKIAGGAVGTSALATGSVDSAKLGNGSVTGEKLGPNAVTGPKIAGATITAANIAVGQVVTGDGIFLTGRQVVANGATDTPVLTLPGVGQLRASCAGAVLGETTISFLNESTAPAEVIAWGFDGLAAISQQTSALANGVSTIGIPGDGSFVMGLDYQIGFVKTGNQEMLTATISAGPAGTSCAVTASAVTTA